MNHTRQYTVIRSRRKTVAIQVLPDGTVTVRAPLLLSGRKIAAFVESREDWITKTASRLVKTAEQTREILPFSEAELKRLKTRARDELFPVIQGFAQQMGVEYSGFSVRAQKTRWGSCSSNRHLNFNCLLVLMPDAVRDYVIVHELCHLLHMDHSPLFWQEVASVLPDYRMNIKWLKSNGAALLAKLPSKNHETE